MKIPGRVSVLLVVFCIPVFLFAQEDDSRTRGLPTMIGGSRCNDAISGADASIKGTLNVRGSTDAGKQPAFSVALYAAGRFISRQRVKNGGSFTFYCVPRNFVSLVAEVDGVEVGNYQLQLEPPPIVNREDINVNLPGPKSADQRRNEVVSVGNLYKRNEANQKLFDKALDELSNGKSENAEKVIEKLLEKDASDFVAWTFLGNIRFNNGRFSDADIAYEKAIALNHDFLPASIGAGRANLGLKNFERSIEILVKAFEKNPDSADVNQYLGEAYLQVKKGTLAITHMRKAIDIAPNEKADLHLRIAALYNAAGAKHLAADEYKLLLQKKPDHPDKKNLEKYIFENTDK